MVADPTIYRHTQIATRWHPDSRDYAPAQERLRHNQALDTFGEMVIVLLMWRIEDFVAGIVGRCSVCFASGNLNDDLIAEVYAQPTKRLCPSCFGTTFEGGIRAKIIRPAIFDDDSGDDVDTRHGGVFVSHARVQLPDDITVRTGDYVVQESNARWQLRIPNRQEMTGEGFGFVHDNTNTGTTVADANLEDLSSVAYTIPPIDTEVRDILNSTGRFPSDWSPYEEIHGPLHPKDFDKSASVRPSNAGVTFGSDIPYVSVT